MCESEREREETDKNNDDENLKNKKPRAPLPELCREAASLSFRGGTSSCARSNPTAREGAAAKRRFWFFFFFLGGGGGGGGGGRAGGEGRVLLSSPSLESEKRCLGLSAAAPDRRRCTEIRRVTSNGAVFPGRAGAARSPGRAREGGDEKEEKKKKERKKERKKLETLIFQGGKKKKMSIICFSMRKPKNRN